MPESMVREAFATGTNKIATTLDLKEAFTTFRLGPTAQRLATVTGPGGK